MKDLQMYRPVLLTSALVMYRWLSTCWKGLNYIPVNISVKLSRDISQSTHLKVEGQRGSADTFPDDLSMGTSRGGTGDGN